MPKKREITAYAPAEVVAAIDAHHARCVALGLDVPRSLAAEGLCRLGLGQDCEPVPRGEGYTRIGVYAGADVAEAVAGMEDTASSAVCALILAGARRIGGAL
jgi:hypothetical protein